MQAATKKAIGLLVSHIFRIIDKQLECMQLMQYSDLYVTMSMDLWTYATYKLTMQARPIAIARKCDYENKYNSSYIAI